MAKTVCIIGAGPAGLAAAKTLTHDHPNKFHVTIFERSHRIGGLWPVSKVDDGLVNPDMCTNQSRHTVSFSDLAWPETAPQFPRAWQVGQYLERYIKTYPGYDIKTQHNVLKTEQNEDKWKVHVVDLSLAVPVAQVLGFDHLIIASGFFGKARTPNILEGVSVPVFHSSQIRDIQSLLTDGGKSPLGPGRRIVVVGGQMSGVEIAANIAFQLSSAAYSVGENTLPNASEYKVTNVFHNPFWVMPFLFPSNPLVEVKGSGEKVDKRNNKSPNFLPLDLIFYNLASRPPGAIMNTSGIITPEQAQQTHGLMKMFLGTDQSEFTKDIAMQDEILTEPPWLAITDQYNEFIRSGNIETVRGKVTGVSSSPKNSVVIKDGSEEKQIDDIAAIVFATGFDAAPSLDFLPEHVLKELKFDPIGDKFPLALNVQSCASRSFPSLGFVGYYRSQYWGIIENQARFLGQLWTGKSNAATALVEDKTMDFMMTLRNNPRASQFPMGDYPYGMESLAEILGIKRTEPEGTPEGTRTGPVVPARYTYDSVSSIQRQQIDAELLDLKKTFEDSTERGRFLPRAIFKAMQGDWKLERVIESRRSDYPSGTLSGVAKFHPRYPTDDAYDMEYLYRESGEFQSAGFRFTATRSYAYRYQEPTDKLSAWFVKPKDNKTVDYLFHELEIIMPAKDSNPTGDEPWRAKSAHLCIDDMYNVKYEFRFRGVSLDTWSQEYTVNGPAKDYTIKNIYRRP